MQKIGDHPLIVRYITSFKDEFNIYIVMESVNGVEFFEALKLIKGVLKP